MVKEKGNKGRKAVLQMATKGVMKLVRQEQGTLMTDVCAIAVEGQNVTYTANTGAKPQDIVDLAGAAGAFISVLAALNPHADAFYPAPSEWKGTVKKSVHQVRTMKKLGFNYEMKGGNKPYPVPHKEQWEDKVLGPDKINPGDWVDIADSAGLACWARDQFYKGIKK